MTYEQEIAIVNLTAAAANLETEIIRRTVDRDSCAAARIALAEVLRVAIAGTVAKDKPPARQFS